MNIAYKDIVFKLSSVMDIEYDNIGRWDHLKVMTRKNGFK